MELNIPNPDAKDLAAAFGVDAEREKELNDLMDAMVASYGTKPVLVRWQHVIADISSFCKGPEELSLCIVIHCAWLQYRGRLIAPIQR